MKKVEVKAEVGELHSVFIDVDAGLLKINGQEINANNVTALSLNAREGKYGLTIERYENFKAEIPLNTEK